MAHHATAGGHGGPPLQPNPGPARERPPGRSRTTPTFGPRLGYRARATCPHICNHHRIPQGNHGPLPWPSSAAGSFPNDPYLRTDPRSNSCVREPVGSRQRHRNPGSRKTKGAQRAESQWREAYRRLVTIQTTMSTLSIPRRPITSQIHCGVVGGGTPEARSSTGDGPGARI